MLGDESPDPDFASLTDAMSPAVAIRVSLLLQRRENIDAPVLALPVESWVPVAVVEDDRVGSLLVTLNQVPF